jgi:hypothetical protein
MTYPKSYLRPVKRKKNALAKAPLGGKDGLASLDRMPLKVRGVIFVVGTIRLIGAPCTAFAD